MAAFFLLGLFNNLTFVINSANATSILPGAIGVVYIINCVPGLLVKLSAPFWWHWFSYRTKVLFVGCCFLANMILTNLGFALSTPLQLLGIGISELGCGLGEATVLALSQFYPNPTHQLSGWSSGTGLAGIVGYLLSMFLLPLLSSWARLGLALGVLGSYWGTYFLLLEPPWVDSLRGGGGEPSAALTPASPRPLRRPAGADEWLCQSSSSSDAESLAADDGGGECGCRGRGVRLQAGSTASLGSAGGGAAVPGGDESQRRRRCELRPGEMGGGSVALEAECVDTEGAGIPKVDALELLDSTARLRLALGLWPYVLPLILVYWAEYAIQSGAWTAFALPPHALRDAAARRRAYQLFNLCYQVGVFLSRSTGPLFVLRRPALWAIAWLQVANLAFFVADGAWQFWNGPSLTMPALLVGCCAGTLYVQTFTAIDRELEPCKRELALSTASVGCPAGILLADLTGLVVQWCLFKANHIILTGGDTAANATVAAMSHCPF